MKPLLDLTDVNYTYQTAEGETPAVKNLSFRVFPDHFLGIIGPSGCGKSTILSLIAGLKRTMMVSRMKNQCLSRKHSYWK